MGILKEKPRRSGASPDRRRGYRSLHGQYWGRVDLASCGSLVADANNQLRGEVRNPLDVELRDCKLCFDRWVYELPPIAARGTRTVGFTSTVKTIGGWLTESRVNSDFKMVSQPWNRQNLDVRRIIRMMMFHDVPPKPGQSCHSCLWSACVF